MRPFLDRLKQLEAEKKRPKSRRIAELLPEIEAALAKGISRAQIVEALKAEDIEVTPSMLSTYLQRLRQRQRTGTAPTQGQPESVEPKIEAGAGPASKYGSHDPRRLDEIMRTPPDMKAFAAKAKNGKGKP